MKNFVLVIPRFSDFNSQGLLKASTHLDLACEAQLAQMAPRYDLALSKFVSKGLRWHIADFKITYSKPIRGFDPVKIEADVVKVDANSMYVDFSFSNESKTLKFAFGTIQFELVGANDEAVEISSEVRESLIKNGSVK